MGLMPADSVNAKLQFSLAQALAGITVLAIMLAAIRQGVFFAIITFIALGELSLILAATLAYLKSHFARTLPELLLRGSVCTAILCGICFGWVPLLMVLDTGDFLFLIPFAIILLIGAVLGLVIAGGCYGWSRWQTRKRIA